MVIEKVFILTSEVALPIGTPTNEVNAETETHSLTTETKQENVESNSKPYILFHAFQLLNHYGLFLPKENVLFHLFFLV